MAALKLCPLDWISCVLLSCEPSLRCLGNILCAFTCCELHSLSEQLLKHQKLNSLNDSAFHLEYKGTGASFLSSVLARKYSQVFINALGGKTLYCLLPQCGGNEEVTYIGWILRLTLHKPTGHNCQWWAVCNFYKFPPPTIDFYAGLFLGIPEPLCSAQSRRPCLQKPLLIQLCLQYFGSNLFNSFWYSTCGMM